MEIRDIYLKYLSAELFDQGLGFPIHAETNAEPVVTDRFSLLERLCAGKRILHLGCADHMALIDKKMSNGTWVHGYLSKISLKCLGIDINRASIDYLQNRLGINNVMYADITEEIPVSIKESSPWDIVFLGEMIEHIDNPVHFLQSLGKGLRGCAKELVMTAPNAISWQNYLNVRKGIECINSDHRYWFTPYTLAKVAHEASFKPTAFYFVTSYKLPKFRGIRSYLHHRRLQRFPGFRETIVLRAAF